MLAPDVNVLVYAYRVDMTQHAPCRRWLENALGADEPVALFAAVLHGFVRVVTHPRAFTKPTATVDALAFVDALLDAPTAVVLAPGERHWDIFRGLVAGLNLKGPDIADAALAAVALEHGCEFVTTDNGFARFAALRTRNPLLS